jgi:hypothetical protein
VAVSSVTGEGLSELTGALEGALSSRMEQVSVTIPYGHSTLLNSLHSLGILDEVQYQDEGIFVRGKVPLFLLRQIEGVLQGDEDDEEDDDFEDADYEGEEDSDDEEEDGVMGGYMGSDEAEADADAEADAMSLIAEDFDWSGLAKGRHDAVRVWEDLTMSMTTTTTTVSYSTASETGAEAKTATGKSIEKLTEALTVDERRRRLQRQRKQKRRKLQVSGQLERKSDPTLSREGASKGNEEEDEEEHWTTLRLLDFDNGEYHDNGDDNNKRDELEDSAQKTQQKQKC